MNKKSPSRFLTSSYFFLTRKKFFILGLSFASFSAYFFNASYNRKKKGIKKLSQRFESTEPKQMINRNCNLLDLIIGDCRAPLAVVFPKNLEELQKIVKYAGKYNLTIRVSDSESITLSPDDKPRQFIEVNPRLMKNFSFSEETQTATVGVGYTLSELNLLLREKGYYLPVEHMLGKENYYLWEALNKDQCRVMGSLIPKGIRDFLVSSLVVLPNGNALKTSTDVEGALSPEYKDLFIGSNSVLGVLSEVSLRVLPLPHKVYSAEILLSGNHEVVKDKLASLQKIVRKNFYDFMDCKLEITSEGRKNLKLLARSPISFEGSHLDDAEWKEGSFNKISGPVILYLRIPSLHLVENVEYFARLAQNIRDQRANIELDIVRGDIEIKIKGIDERATEVNARMLDSLINYTIERGGVFLGSSDSAAEKRIKEKTLLLERGRNNLVFFRKLKKMLDPKGILLNDNFLHPGINLNYD